MFCSLWSYQMGLCQKNSYNTPVHFCRCRCHLHKCFKFSAQKCFIHCCHFSYLKLIVLDVVSTLELLMSGPQCPSCEPLRLDWTNQCVFWALIRYRRLWFCLLAWHVSSLKSQLFKNIVILENMTFTWCHLAAVSINYGRRPGPLSICLSQRAFKYQCGMIGNCRCNDDTYILVKDFAELFIHQ